MKIERRGIRLSVWLCALLVACGGDGKEGKAGSSCSVREKADGAITVSCDDGSKATLNPPTLPDAGSGGGACTVERDDDSVTITCPDGSTATIPTDSTAIDGGVAPVDAGGGDVSCTVDEAANGAITIRCPDGSEVTIPGTGTVSNRAIGATAASCGTCHDSSSAKTHFKVMTFDSDAGPEETCGTCHRETSLEPVSRVHARAELGLPGLAVSIESAYVDPIERTVGARLRITDASGVPVARDGISFSFLVAKVGTEAAIDGSGTLPGAYTDYITRSVTQKDNPDFPLGDATPRTVVQPSTEAGTGAFTLVEDGVYDYAFSTKLPEGYDANATHLIGLYATRTVEGTRFVANATKFFVPSDPNLTPQKREAVRTETCNKCHNPLSAHGGARQEVQLCLGCHTQGATDPESGESIDFRVMVHKIHRGKELPSVEEGGRYAIVGYGNATQDYSDVGYPQPIENCQSCHTDQDSNRWTTNGSRETCTSCHEGIDKPWEEGGHPFPISAQTGCTTGNCHGPTGRARTVKQAHLTFLNNPKAAVFDVDIVSVAVASADAAPVIRIRARTGTRATAEGALTAVTSASRLRTLNVFLNGPNTGFLLSGNTIEQFAKADLVDLTPDLAVPGDFTFALPESLRDIVGTLGDPELDSYTIAIRAEYDPTPTGTPDTDRVDQRDNPTFAFTASEELVTRRAVVLTEKCNNCHGDLTGHGGDILAKNVEQCAMCHTGSLDTRVRQGANKVAGPTKSLRLATLIHRIHGDSIATTPYVLYGYAPSAPPYPELDFSEVPFPGNVRDCTTCHADGTYLLPLPEGNPPTQTAILDADGNVIAE